MRSRSTTSTHGDDVIIRRPVASPKFQKRSWKNEEDHRTQHLSISPLQRPALTMLETIVFPATFRHRTTRVGSQCTHAEVLVFFFFFKCHKRTPAALSSMSPPVVLSTTLCAVEAASPRGVKFGPQAPSCMSESLTPPRSLARICTSWAVVTFLQTISGSPPLTMSGACRCAPCVGPRESSRRPRRCQPAVDTLQHFTRPAVVL